LLELEEFRKMDPLWLACSRYRRRRFDDCLTGCDALLQENSRDSAALLLKTKALTSQAYYDDTELEEEGVAELLLDDNATAAMPRPGTSINRPSMSRQGGGPDQSVRPVSSSGRPLTGFVAPGLSRPLSQQMTVETAFKGSRPGSSRPATTLGREVRLATASLAAEPSGRSIDTNRLNLARLAMYDSLASALVVLYSFTTSPPHPILFDLPTRTN
jgi:tetratricopeptide repeat protein 8